MDLGTFTAPLPPAERSTWEQFSRSIPAAWRRWCTVSAAIHDGANPYAGLVMDGADDLYGTTEMGAFQTQGPYSRLTPAVTRWCPTALMGGTSDGADPKAGLIFDPAGNLYGTTFSGGGWRLRDRVRAEHEWHRDGPLQLYGWCRWWKSIWRGRREIQTAFYTVRLRMAAEAH